MSIKLEELQEILIQSGIDAAKRSETMKIAKEFEDEKKAEKEEDKASANKNKYRQIVFVRGDEELKTKLSGGAWIVKVADANDGTNVQKTLITCAARQNSKIGEKKSGRGRKSKGGKINSFYQLFGWLKSKIIKEVATGPDELKIVTKEPVEVQVITTEDVPFSS